MVALSMGCGLELAAGDGAGADAETDTGDAGLTTGEGDTPSDTGLTTDTADPTGGDSTSGAGPNGSSGTGEDGWVETPECDAIDCSGGGYCDVADEGAQCFCDPGWATVGLDCLPCETIGGDTLPAVVPAVQASFRYSFDGGEPPTAANQYARLSLRNRATGDVVKLPDTLFGNASVLLVPGIYDVMYEHREGNILPKNGAAVLQHV